MFYTCPRAVEEKWFSRAKISKNWKVTISFNPNSTNTIYLHSTDIGSEECQLTEKSVRYADMSWFEAGKLRRRNLQVQEAAADDQFRRKVQFAYRQQSAVKGALREKRDFQARESVSAEKATKAVGRRLLRRQAIEEERADRRSAEPLAENPEHGPVQTATANSEAEDAYVPPPSNAHLYRKRRSAA